MVKDWLRRCPLGGGLCAPGGSPSVSWPPKEACRRCLLPQEGVSVSQPLTAGRGWLQGHKIAGADCASGHWLMAYVSPGSSS